MVPPVGGYLRTPVVLHGAADALVQPATVSATDNVVARMDPQFISAGNNGDERPSRVPANVTTFAGIFAKFRMGTPAWSKRKRELVH